MVHGMPARRKSSQINGIANGNGNCTPSVATANGDVELLPTPPDGGWGWMVVFGSFMIHIVTDGMTYSFGLFYDVFLTYFNEGKGYTAWIASIMVGVTFASGPISSSFVNRYGCRAVTIAGSILAAFCIIISIFAQNILTLIITIGFGTGLGFGLIYLPAIVSVTQYFESKRSLATGIAVCGSGFGTFVFAPLTNYLLAAYGWRGAMLIIGGIVLNCIIFGAMFRPLEVTKAPKMKKSIIIDNNTTKAELEPLKAKTNCAKLNDQYLQLPLRTEGGATLCRSNSMGHKSNLNNNTNRNNSNYKSPNLVATVKSTSNDNILRVFASQPQLTQLREIYREKWISGTMYRPDALYQGSLHNISEYANSRNDRSTSGVIKRYGSLRQNREFVQNQEEEKSCGCIRCSKETRDTFAEMMNFSLLKNLVFIIFAISNFCTSIGFNMPYLYIVAQAKTFKIDTRKASYLISTIGVANTIGRIILGYIADKPWVNRLLVYNFCLTLCGVSTILVPFCKDFTTLIIYAAVFGFTIGAYVGLTSVILVDLLGLDKLTNAFGLLLLFQGIASFIGPPIGGWMYDLTESYCPAFILAGLMIAISGLVMFAIPLIQHYYEQKAEQRINSEQLALS